MISKLKVIRQMNNLTQHQLGKMLGVTSATVCYWETGRLEPSDAPKSGH